MAISKISTVEIGSGGAASIDFTSIPGTYTDLMVVCSLREASTTGSTAGIRFNNDSATNYLSRRLQGNGSSALSATYSSGTEIDIIIDASDMTSSTFGSMQMYVPNYAGATNKSVSIESLSENNATLAYQRLSAGIWNSTAAITSIKIFGSAGNLAQYSSATLYGVLKGSSGGVTVS